MELHYEVQIDTKKAQLDVEDLESVFDKMGASTEKSIQRLATWGKEITQDMKDGKITTTEATQSIIALQNEIRRLSVSEQGLGNESKAQLRQANQGLTVLGQSVRKLERTRTQAHTQNMRQLKEQERERKKIEAMDRREEARNKRMNIAASRRLGNAIKGAGASGLGSAVGSIAGMAKFGVAGMGIGALFSIIPDFIERYKSSFDIIGNAWDNFFAKIKYGIDKIIAKLPFSNVDADDNLHNDMLKDVRNQYESIIKDLESIHKKSSSVNDLIDAIDRIKKAVPSLKDYTNEQLIRGSLAEQIAKAKSDFANNQFVVALDKVSDIKNSKINDNINDYYKRLTEIEKKKEARQKQFDDSIEEFEKNGINYNRRNMTEILERDMAVYEEEKEVVHKLLNEEYDILLKEKQKIADRISAEMKLTDIIKKKEQAEKEAETRAKAMQAINGIAKADKGSTYGELLVNANETKKAQLAQLAKYKQYANTEEYQKALARIDAQFKDSVDEVNKIVGDMFDEIDSKFEESSENSLQKTKRNIHDAYEKMRKELKDFLEIDEVYEERERKLNELENRALEDADLEHSLKMITKESEAKENAIKTSTKYLDEEERENDIKREQIASIEKQIEAIEKQNHVSEKERDMLEQLRMQWSMLRHEIEQTAEERKKYYDEERRLAIVEGITNIGGTLSSSSNPYVSAIGSMMGNFSGIQDLQRLRAQQLQFMKAEDQAWLNGDIKGAEAARAGARASKAQATASAVNAAVQFGADVFNAFADSAEQGRQALEEWNAKLADSAHQLALLTIEEYEYKQRNIFGVDDPYKKMQASIDKERVAQQEAAKALSKMANEGIVQTGTKKKAEGKTVAQIAASGAGAGALIGAAAGSAATPVGTIIGTAAGAIVGAVTGIFASRKEVAIYDSLKAKYGEVYNKDTLEINKQILADYGKMDEATKKLVDNAKELLAKQKEAHEEFLSYIQDMVGTMGSDISNILVNAFRSRDIKMAMDDLKGYLTQTIEGVLQEEVFGLVFGDAFDSLEAQLKNIKNEDGQIVGKIDEPISSFIHNIEDGMAEYADLMNQLQEKYKRYGYDIFTDDMEAQQEALQGAISGMTEETAGKINGNFMGLKLTAMEVSDKVSSINNLFDEANRIARASLDALNAIAENTSFCQRLERLSADIADIKNNGLICR